MIYQALVVAPEEQIEALAGAAAGYFSEYGTDHEHFLANLVTEQLGWNIEEALPRRVGDRT